MNDDFEFDLDEFENVSEDDGVSDMNGIFAKQTTDFPTKWLLEKNVENYNWLNDQQAEINVSVPIFNTHGVTYPTIHNDMKRIDDTHVNDTWPLTYRPNFAVNIKQKFEQMSPEVYNVLGEKHKILKHQAVIQRFMSPHSINRGLLLYHKVGSGKTLSAILVAEDHYKMMRELHSTPTESSKRQIEKSRFDVIYLIPATLRKNTEEEIDTWANLYRKHYGDSTVRSAREHKIFHYNAVTLIPYIKSLPDQFFNPTIVPADSKYTKMNIDEWINEMLTNNNIPIEVNPLRNKLYVIDEIHNIVSLMKNQTKKQEFLYKFFMNMRNCKILAMSGTPIRKDPYELAILMNILR